jgi:hypothetical protein
MNSNSATDVAKLRQEVEARFFDAVKYTSNRSSTALQNYNALRQTIREFDNPASDVADYILNKSKAIFGTQPYQKNFSWLNPEALYEQTNEINNAPDVVFFQTDMFWFTCCLYAEVRSLSLLLNQVFPTTIKRKPGNSIYKGFLIMEERLKTRLPRSPEKREIYFKENMRMREEFQKALLVSTENNTDYMEYPERAEVLEQMMSGDVRGIQKTLFPLLLRTIVLKSEAVSGNLGVELQTFSRVFIRPFMPHFLSC